MTYVSLYGVEAEDLRFRPAYSEFHRWPESGNEGPAISTPGWGTASFASILLHPLCVVENEFFVVVWATLPALSMAPSDRRFSWRKEIRSCGCPSRRSCLMVLLACDLEVGSTPMPIHS